jgi:hypothetical protein
VTAPYSLLSRFEHGTGPAPSFADAMFPAAVRDNLRRQGLAIPCPNSPPCGHSGLLHDVQDWDDTLPRCCSDGCLCGAAPVPAEAETAASSRAEAGQ